MASAATEDAINPSAPAPVSVLPQYPELIMAAIESLDSKKGVCRSKISKQIEASYGSLPAAHKTLLSHHLNRMRATGELVVINNNYIKADPNTPLRRGRGRPRKPPSEFYPISTGSGRKRGRPPMYGTPAKKPASGEGRGRGRPRKEKPEGDASAGHVATSALVVCGSRGRGRPRKEPKSGDDAMNVTASGEKRGRGRPRKDGGSGVKVKPMTVSGEKRGRGRPKKVVVTTEVVVGMD